jgi:hypothetical protein
MAMSARKYKVGAFLEAGGNLVLFCNGVMGVLNREDIHIDYLVGLSSSAPIVFAYMLNMNTRVAQIFYSKLIHNKRNFYVCKKPYFPHNDIYESSVTDILNGYDMHATTPDFLILGSRTTARLSRLKGLCATLFLVFAYGLKIDLLGLYRHIFHVEPMYVGRYDGLTRTELIDFVMGTSTIYPFIGLHYVRDQLILEGALWAPDYREFLSDCERKIVIHTSIGKTEVVEDTFHIYADERMPNNILDYTNGPEILRLHALGERVMNENLQLLRDFIGIAG